MPNTANTAPTTSSKTGDEAGNKGEDWRKTSLLDRQEVALKNNLFTDVCFIVGAEKQRISAIKSILSLGSSVFATMLSERWSSDGNEIAVPDVEPDAFYELLRFIYCEKVDLRKDVIWSLLYAADKYDVEALKKMCVDSLKNSLTASNVSFYLMKAKLLGVTDLMNLCFEKLSKEAHTAIFNCPKDDEVNFCFHDLDIQTVCCILEMDNLEIEEVHLYESILGWATVECRRKNLDENKINMRSVLEPALPLIRFKLMSLEDFMGSVVNHFFHENRILSSEETLSILTYLASKPRLTIPRPIPRFQKSIKILIHDEKSKETFYVKVKCSDTVADLRRIIKDRAVRRDDVVRYGSHFPNSPDRQRHSADTSFLSSLPAATPTPVCDRYAPPQALATTETGVSADTYSLSHENLHLWDCCLLSDYGIENESVIILRPERRVPCEETIVKALKKKQICMKTY